MALIGNTVRVTGEFVTWAGSRADAVGPKLNVYEKHEKQLLESIPLEDCRKDVGMYQIDYVIPDGLGNLFFEIVGDVEGMPEVARIKEERVWHK
jgi:hypothetical protein